MKRRPSACLALVLAGILSVLPAHSQDRSPPPAVAPQRDTVQVHERVQNAPRRTRMQELGLPALAGKRDHFGRMQKGGFALLMGGIGLAACGVTLMVIGFNENAQAVDEWRNSPAYYREDAPN